jgi:glycosyltransferase involved in cell wall biosynthesis
MHKQHKLADSMLKVGFLTVADARNVKAWSGTPFYMALSLAHYLGSIDHLGPLEPPLLPLIKAYARVVRVLSGKRYSALHSPLAVSRFAALASRKIRASRPDVVFAPAGSMVTGGVPADVPLIYSSDATSRLIHGYHPDYRTISHSSARNAEWLERESIGRADLLLYPSDWAARSAIEDYGAESGKVHVIPWGANFDDPPDRQVALAPREVGKCRMLFVGVDWQEKGASIAVDALRSLRSMGVDAELTICGCTPPQRIEAEGLEIVPFLDKNDPAQLRRLQDHYRAAHFFFLPTRAECYGIVFCEASAYGLPSIATATGGVPGVVREGENGHLLPTKASGQDFARLIAAIHGDQDRYMKLRESSRAAFETRLNWDIWGKRTAALVVELLAAGRRAGRD